jgi:transcription elongation factor GreA-like protein
VFNFEHDSKTTNFPINLGSNIFAIKLHKWFQYNGNLNYGKKEDFDECIYFTKYTDDSFENNRQAREEMIQIQIKLFSNHPKFQNYIQNNKIQDYKGNNFMFDILGKDEYYEIIRLSSQNQLEVYKETKYEAVLNKNNI